MARIRSARERRRTPGIRTGNGTRGGRLRVRSTGHITTQSLGDIEITSAFHSVMAELSEAAAAQVLKKTAHGAMKPVQLQARINARQFDGHENDKDGHWGSLSYSGRKVKFPRGYTAKSIRRKSYLSGDKRYANTIVTVTSPAFYAVAFVERGHRDMLGKPVRAQPWLVPAFESKKNIVLALVQSELKKHMDAAIKTRERRAARLASQ